MAQRGDDPSHKYRKEIERIKSSALSQRDTDAVLECLSALDPNDMSAKFTNQHGRQETLSYSSLTGYGRGLRLLGKESDCELLEHTNDSLQRIFDSWLDGLAKQTVRQRQAGAIKFYRYHDTDVNPDGIVLIKIDQGGSVDERDMFTKEEIQAMRDASDNTRDRCLLELLVYTGQRIRAIQTLRLKDIDLEEGVYYLNTEEEGLKGADKNGKKRPLLGAEKAVRQWMDNHPTGNPDDYLITHLPSASGTHEKGEYLSAPALRHRLWKMADEAGFYDHETKEGKSPNPHAFRHYFVTVCYREYDMDPSTIKYLIGHDQSSKIMETTYQHLTDEDYINDARRQSGAGREPDEKQSSFTPETCPTCDEPLPPQAKACPDCGMVFTPDAQAAKDTLQEDAEQAIPEADSELEAKIVRRVLEDVRENPQEYL